MTFIAFGAKNENGIALWIEDDITCGDAVEGLGWLVLDGVDDGVLVEGRCEDEDDGELIAANFDAYSW